MEEGPQILAPPPAAPMDPISRPSSASTQSSSLAQLPSLTALAAATAADGSSPQLRTANPPVPPPVTFTSSSPAATAGGPGNGIPTCQNCSTSTTPLWRRDEMGAVLCNACGLFLKLHGRPRPISLKTDVIKSRNRVKTSMRPDMMKKKQQAAPTDASNTDLQGQAYAAAALQARRTSQKSANGHAEVSESPISRTGTPHHVYNPNYPAYPAPDGAQHQAQTLAGFGAPGNSPGRAPSPMNGERLDVAETPEQLIAFNASLKTRVSELEIINDFIQRRLSQYEPYGGPAQDGQAENGHAEAQLRAQLDAITQSEAQLRSQLDESHRRENMLKRRLDEMETELKDAKDALEAYESGRVKKPRLEEEAPPALKDDTAESTPLSEPQ